MKISILFTLGCLMFLAGYFSRQGQDFQLLWLFFILSTAGWVMSTIGEIIDD